MNNINDRILAKVNHYEISDKSNDDTLKKAKAHDTHDVPWLPLHYLELALDGFLDVGKGFFAGLALREAAWQRWNFRNVVAGFVLFNNHAEFPALSQEEAL